MRVLSVPLILIAFCMTIATCESFGQDSSSHRLNSLIGGGDSDNSDTSDSSMDKRQERYAFGLGRRAYTYTSGSQGVKRLPVYNFGLGKRARPYSFGLGKRADTDDDYSDTDGTYDSWSVVAPGSDKYDNGIKRGRPYSFGLGKRLDMENEAMERRSAAQRYNFGLGRR